MSRIEALNQRYSASAHVARTGIEIVAVGDPAGARFNTMVRRLNALLRDQSGDYLEDLAGAAKALRWRRITHPQPLEFNPSLIQLAREVTKQAGRLRGAIEDQGLLDELDAGATGLASTEPSVGPVLLRSIEEVGTDAALVIAASRSAAAGLKLWLQEYGVLVLTAGELEHHQFDCEQAYVVGPPRFFRSSVVTSPVTTDISFLIPAWFGQCSVPRSPIAAYAEGAIRIEARVFTEGDTSGPGVDLPDRAEEENEYFPQPVWGHRGVDPREPASDEVQARKVLLCGNLAMWLDDGERIRSLDPDQPDGERVTYTDVRAVCADTYLLLRKGETERNALHQAAVARLAQGEVVEHTQDSWKRTLSERIQMIGHRQVIRQLRDAGVKTADRAVAWTDPGLIRPASDEDFERLLRWLDIPIEPTFGYATMLRKTLYRVSAEIGKQLEAAVAAADLSELTTAGHLSLDITTEGFRGILATRVLAVSPFTEIVSRHDARVPFEDRGGQWLG